MSLTISGKVLQTTLRVMGAAIAQWIRPAPGSSPKHTIYTSYSQILYYIVIVLRKGRKKQKEAGFGPFFLTTLRVHFTSSCKQFYLFIRCRKYTFSITTGRYFQKTQFLEIG